MSVRVLFVGGLGRSGSTVLDLLLGDVPGVAAIGEVRHLWERGLRDNSLCACGEPFHDCPFWQRVGEVAFGGWEPSTRTEAIADRARGRSPPPAAGDRRPTGRPAARPRALRRPARAPVLGGGRGRGCAASSSTPARTPRTASSCAGHRASTCGRRTWSATRGASPTRGRSRCSGRTPADGALMTRTSVARTALMWVDANMLVELLARQHVPTVRVRYEDLVADPEGQVRRVLHLAGLEPAAAPRRRRRSTVQHAIAGNPVRFTAGRSRWFSTTSGAARCRRATAGWRPRSPPRCSGATGIPRGSRERADPGHRDAAVGDDLGGAHAGRGRPGRLHQRAAEPAASPGRVPGRAGRPGRASLPVHLPRQRERVPRRLPRPAAAALPAAGRDPP